MQCYLIFKVDAWNIQAVQVDSARLLIALLLAPLTWRGICSSYLLMLWLFFPMAVSDLGQKLTATKPKGNVFQWMVQFTMYTIFYG